MPRITDAQIENDFQHRELDVEAAEDMGAIWALGAELAKMIRDKTPDGLDQQLALRTVHDGIRLAERAIKCMGAGV